MHSATTIQRTRTIEHLMDAKALTIQRLEADPQERLALAQGLALAKEHRAELAQSLNRADKVIKMFEWLMKFDHRENVEHDMADRALGAATISLESVRPINAKSRQRELAAQVNK